MSRAGLRGQLRIGADRVDVALVELLRCRERKRGAQDVGVAFTGFENRLQLRVREPIGGRLPPSSFVFSFGLKPSLSHSVAWNGVLNG